MALSKKDKKLSPRLPVCKWCGASGQHYSWQCAKKPTKCKNCGSKDHAKLHCPSLKRRRLKPESSKHKEKRLATKQEWYRLNPPDKSGYWICYLQISEDCPRLVNKLTINLEHVLPKVRRPDLAFDVTNIKASCQPCNKLKGDLSPDELWRLHTIRPSKEFSEAYNSITSKGV